MVENIDEIERDLAADALRHADIFLHTKVRVPVGQPADRPESAAVPIKPQNQRANMSEDSRWIREHVRNPVDVVNRGTGPGL